MSSAHDTFFADAKAHLLQQQGQSVTWITGAGVSSTFTAIVGGENLISVETETGVVNKRVRVVQVPVASVADPNRGDVCTIGGVAWAFDQAEWNDGNFAGVRVCRPEQAEISHRGYRGMA